MGKEDYHNSQVMWREGELESGWVRPWDDFFEVNINFIGGLLKKGIMNVIRGQE